MSLLLFFTGVGRGRRNDRHDGVWDERKWKKYQELLRKRRKALAEQERKAKARRLTLRKELTNLYRGLPEEQKETIAAAPSLSVVQEPQAFTHILAGLASIQQGLSKNKQALISEYLEITRRIQEQDEEDELEMILMAVL